MKSLSRHLLVLLVAVMLAAAGCSIGKQPALAGTSWRLTGWAESTPLPGGVQLTATFDDSMVSGSSGVNTYGGGYLSDTDGTVYVKSLRMTLMGGSPDALAAESTFTNRLQAARGYRIDGDTLVLIDAEGKDSLTFAPAS